MSILTTRRTGPTAPAAPADMRLHIFASGSTGNCSLLCIGGRRFLLDAGLSARAIKNALAEAGYALTELDGIFITHEHTDHVSGLAQLCKNVPLAVYAPGTVASHLRGAQPGVDASLRELRPEEPQVIGGVTVTAFPTPHDSAQSVGYRFEGEGLVFAFATDTGHVTETMRRYLTGSDMALIEANHDLAMLRQGPYPAFLKQRVLSARGHLSNDDCAVLAGELARRGCRKLILGHLSRQNNLPSLARRAVAAALEGTDTELFIAPEKGRLDIEVEPCCKSASSARAD